MQLDSADVVIIGGGVTGLSAAWFLARAGVNVVVVEKGTIGWEASGRNGGCIAYHRGPSPRGLLGYEEVRLWRTLEGELGYPCEYVPGEIAVCLGEYADVENDSWGGKNWEEMVSESNRRNRMGWRSEVLDAKTMRDMFPAINPNVVGGLYDPDGGHANPQRTVQAYAWALQDNGGRIHQHTTATGFHVKAGKVVTVETTRGTISTDFVVCAAGPQTGILAEMVGSLVPLAPSRIEIFVTEPVAPMKIMAEGNGLYGRQTRRGNLAYGGGGSEWLDIDDMSTPDKPNTPLIRTIAQRLRTLFPGLEDTRIIRSWSGISERTPDDEPIIDMLPSTTNVLVASATFDGFGLSPVHGEAISELVMHGESLLPLEGYRLSRFADLPSDWRKERGWVPGAVTVEAEW